jgi:hypothetical protein
MPFVGDRPERGVRFVLARPSAGGPPWSYAGAAFTRDTEHRMSARIEADGAVHVEATGAPPELAERARLILRAAYKQAKSEGDLAPARRIVRWRADKQA